jgi:hypothetical protein
MPSFLKQFYILRFFVNIMQFLSKHIKKTFVKKTEIGDFCQIKYKKTGFIKKQTMNLWTEN